MSEYILTDKMRAWASAHGWDAELHIDGFNDYLANKTGKPYKDLDAAFRQCVRGDWGGMRRQAMYSKPQQGGLNGGAGRWWTSDAGIIAEGRRLGLEARPGETMNSYKARIEAKQ